MLGAGCACYVLAALIKKGIRMTGRLVALCLLVGYVMALPRASERTQSTTALVTVIADAQGPVRDLSAKDFTVREKNNTREVTAADLSNEPMSVVLLVDTAKPPAGTMPPTQDLRAALLTFVKTLQNGSPEARVALGEFAGASVVSVDFAAEAGAVEKNIQRLAPNLQTSAVLLEALVDAGKMLAARPAPRRAVVTVDYNSPETSADRTMKQAAESLQKAGATLWSVSIRGSGSATTTREETLNKMSDETGGMRLFSVDSTGLSHQLKIIAHSLLSQYSVTFTSARGNPKDIVIATGRGKALLSRWMR